MAKLTVRYIRAHMKDSGGCFLDLGSNIGEVSILLASRFDSIVAVEAHPDTFSISRKRVAEKGLQKKIQIINAVVAKTTGQKFFVSTPKHSTGVTARAIKKNSTYHHSVRTVSFQDLLNKYRPRVCKMDVEGSEYECLGEVKIGKHLDLFLVEFHAAASLMNFDRLVKCCHNLHKQGWSIDLPPKVRLNGNLVPKFGFILFIFRRRRPVVTIDSIIEKCQNS